MPRVWTTPSIGAWPCVKAILPKKCLTLSTTFLKVADKDDFYLAGIAKGFETCLDFAWRYLKRLVIEEGLAAIKLAGVNTGTVVCPPILANAGDFFLAVQIGS